MAAYPAPPSYGAYDQQPPPQPGFGYPPNPSQPYYPPPPQPGYPQQPGYQPYQPGMQPTVAQPTGGGYYPGQPPTQTITLLGKRKRKTKPRADFEKDCCICACCSALCYFLCAEW